LTANEPAFARYFAERGTRMEKVGRPTRSVLDAEHALAYLESVYPGSIREACFIDRSGAEIARAVDGHVAPVSDLSPEEARTPFFSPAFALASGEVHQTLPYRSPDTHDWVVANATSVTVGGINRGIVHFEVAIEGIRQSAAAGRRSNEIRVVDARTGRVVIDADHRQPTTEPLARGCRQRQRVKARVAGNAAARRRRASAAAIDRAA
jgi:hypothetical protein